MERVRGPPGSRVLGARMGIVARSTDGVARLLHIASQAVDARQDSGRAIRWGL